MTSYHLNTPIVTSTLWLSVFSLSFSVVAAPASADLLPHRAVYELSLMDAERDSGIESASGLFVFQITGSACAGWRMNSSMALNVLNRTGNSLRSETDYSAFEAPAGDLFTYESNTRTTGEAPSMVTGAAQRNDPGGLSMRRLSDEESTAMADAGTLFPNQLTLALLDAAMADEALFFSRVFDGSHSSGEAQAVTAVIGEVTQPSVLTPIRTERRATLDNGPVGVADDALEVWDDFDTPVAAWPVLLSYFDPLEPDSLPSFQVSYTLDDNGVSDDVVLRYRSFSLRAVLSDFSAFRPADCSE